MNWCATHNRRWQQFIFLDVNPGDFWRIYRPSRARYAVLDHNADLLKHLNILTTASSELRPGKYWKGQSVDRVEITGLEGLLEALWDYLCCDAVWWNCKLSKKFSNSKLRLCEVDWSYLLATQAVTSQILVIGSITPLCLFLHVFFYYYYFPIFFVRARNSNFILQSGKEIKSWKSFPKLVIQMVNKFYFSS